MILLQETDVPNDIAFAARRLNRWMEEHGHRDWQLMGVCDRSHASKYVNLVETILGQIDRSDLHRFEPNPAYRTIGGVIHDDGIIPMPVDPTAFEGNQRWVGEQLGQMPGTAQPMTTAEFDQEVARLTRNEAARVALNRELMQETMEPVRPPDGIVAQGPDTTPF